MEIQYKYWLDATKEDPSFKANGKTWQNTKGSLILLLQAGIIDAISTVFLSLPQAMVAVFCSSIITGLTCDEDY